MIWKVCNKQKTIEMIHHINTFKKFKKLTSRKEVRKIGNKICILMTWNYTLRYSKEDNWTLKIQY